MHISELETPCLILDIEKVKHNIETLNQKLKAFNVDLRPHGKTAKNIDLMRMAVNSQDKRITASTVKEAEYFFEHGIKDIIYAVGIAPNKLDRCIALIKNGADLKLTLDSIEQVQIISEKASAAGISISVLIEIDCDDHRAGVQMHDPLLLDIAAEIQNTQSVQLSGILTHAGASYDCQHTEEIKQIAQQEHDIALHCAKTLRSHQFDCPIISIGSTPTAYFSEDLSGITEIRAGVYLFQDLVMAGLGVCTINEIALSVLTSVIGQQAEKSWLLCDAGWMALSRDRGTAKQSIDQGYGLVCNLSNTPSESLIVSSTNQEHGIISDRNNAAFNIKSYGHGTLLRILPNHACATAAMHDRYYVTDGSDKIIDVWERINGW